MFDNEENDLNQRKRGRELMESVSSTESVHSPVYKMQTQTPIQSASENSVQTVQKSKSQIQSNTNVMLEPQNI